MKEKTFELGFEYQVGFCFVFFFLNRELKDIVQRGPQAFSRKSKEHSLSEIYVEKRSSGIKWWRLDCKRS